MPTDQENAEHLRERLRGPFIRIGCRVDVISRITQVCLVGADDSLVYVGNKMVDIAERHESGQICITDGKQRSTTEFPAQIDFSPGTFSLTKLWFTDTDIGSLVTGLSFLGPLDQEILITTAAEIYSLYVSVGAFSSVSEPEYKDSDYRVVAV